MGLLLIEKKELAAKDENLTQQLFEAQQLQTNMQAEHMAVISEFEKKEGHMQRAMDFQRQSIANVRNYWSLSIMFSLFIVYNCKRSYEK